MLALPSRYILMENSDLTIELTDIAHGGDAIGRHEGKVVFVPYAIPGERVRVHLEEVKKSYARARLEQVLFPSSHRVEPLCPHFGTCGGCQWQQIDYPQQLDYKQQIVAAQLRRIGKLDDPPVHATLGMTDPWRYRNHAQFAVSPEGFLGFRARRSHWVIPIHSCPLLHPLLDDTLRMLDVDFPGLARVSIRAGVRTGDVLVAFQGRTDEVPAVEIDAPVSCVFIARDGAEIILAGSRHIREEVAGRSFRVSVDSFFQVNTDQTEQLIRILEEGLDLHADDRLLDAYCGVGTLSLPLADRVAEVIGIESHGGALDDARVNASGLNNVRLIQGRVEDILANVPDPVDALILDPPRRGCHRAVIRALCAHGPQRIAYVSCDPATLARDVRLLVHEGGYDLRCTQPIDMFPQTYHIESISFLVRDRAP